MKVKSVTGFVLLIYRRYGTLAIQGLQPYRPQHRISLRRKSTTRERLDLWLTLGKLIITSRNDVTNLMCFNWYDNYITQMILIE